MEKLMIFSAEYGMWLTVIAVFGIAMLGALKYFKIFENLEEKKRHYLYIGVSVCFSAGATAIYLAAVDAFELNYWASISCAIFALNQTFYSIFKVTPINEFVAKNFDTIVKFLKKVFNKKSEGENDEKK